MLNKNIKHLTSFSGLVENLVKGWNMGENEEYPSLNQDLEKKTQHIHTQKNSLHDLTSIGYRFDQHNLAVEWFDWMYRCKGWIISTKPQPDFSDIFRQLSTSCARPSLRFFISNLELEHCRWFLTVSKIFELKINWRLLENSIWKSMSDWGWCFLSGAKFSVNLFGP